MFMPRIVSWNCRGTGSEYFVRYLMNLIKTTVSDILVLLETRVNSSCIHNFLAHTSFSGFLAAEADGFAGGIWVLWSNVNLNLNLELVSMDDQFVNMIVHGNGGPPWLLTAIYASPKLNFCSALWSYLENLG